jgi:hypothetical protein
MDADLADRPERRLEPYAATLRSGGAAAVSSVQASPGYLRRSAAVGCETSGFSR